MPDCHERHYISLNSQGFHRIAYTDWAPENERIVICIHGLTGNAHDFDWLAPALTQDGYRVIAVDMPGRGRSDFLPNPQDYRYEQYLHDLTALLGHLGVIEPQMVDWIGISMGGLLGIIMAGMAHSPVRRLIVNDIGPTVPQAALDFISQYISQSYEFDTLAEMESFMRQTRGLSWGPITDEQWAQMAENNARALPNGKLTYSFDPQIADVFAEEPVGDLDLWHLWDAIDIPVLTLRGADSTLFPQSVADEMLKRGPGGTGKVTLEVLSGCGHVPSLMAPEQIALLRGWLGKV